ncbi:MAG: ATP-binding cassette domain-containing protein [Pseudomonadota bacterium]
MNGLRVQLNGLAYRNFALDVDFAVTSGTCTGIFGRSGSGKSTLLRCIAGVQHIPGEIHWNNEAWLNRETRVAAHIRRAAMVFQSPTLLPHRTVEQNLNQGLRHSPKGDRTTVAKLAGQFELTNLLQRAAGSLSGGQQQRVALARAVAASPPVLLLDEPLTGLDSEAQDKMLQVLMRLQQTGQTILFVSHSASALGLLANHIIVISDGVQTLQGTSQEIFEHPLAPQPLTAQAGVMLRNGKVAENNGGLARVVFGDVEFQVASTLLDGASLNLRILADDVSIALPTTGVTSIMNSLPSIISSVAVTDANPMALLTLDCKGVRLLSRITKKALQKLGVGQGDAVEAQVKSAAIIAFPTDAGHDP